MSFVDGFYTFNLEISDTLRNVYVKVREKTPKHPEETLLHLFARTIAFSHSYENELEFSKGLFDVKEPAIWRKDILGNIQTWVEVGIPEQKRFERALRSDENASFRVYFYNNTDVKSFCGRLRGSETNWVSRVQFFKIDPEILEQLTSFGNVRQNWSITFLEDVFFISSDAGELHGYLHPIDIWREYQNEIGNS